MSISESFFRVFDRLFPAETVHAHCDIPCGIYDPHNAQIAALSVARMHQLIDGLARPSATSTSAERDSYVHNLNRYTAAKEQHAELCKHELRILWGDYFKPEHLEKHPKLHDLFWNALKQASKVRQNIDAAAAEELLSSVQAIAEVFWETKGAGSVRQPSRQTGGGELVYPKA